MTSAIKKDCDHDRDHDLYDRSVIAIILKKKLNLFKKVICLLMTIGRIYRFTKLLCNVLQTPIVTTEPEATEETEDLTGEQNIETFDLPPHRKCVCHSLNLVASADFKKIKNKTPPRFILKVRQETKSNLESPKQKLKSF